MGNDGGSIPTRRELVKEAARNPTTTQLKETQKEQLAHRWSMCPLSHKPLIRPVVSDCAGNLYNKDAVLQYLLPAVASSLDKVECDKYVQGRIKALKDVVEVIFELHMQDKREKLICPVTSKELGPSVKAAYVVPCGHAFSQEAIKEMKSDQCLQCNTAYETKDVIPIFPITEDEQEKLKARMESLSASGLTHSLKKVSGSSKKRKANGVVKSEVSMAEESAEVLELATTKPRKDIPRSETPQSDISTPKIMNGIQNAATANLAAKVLQEEEARKKRKKMGENENIKSLFSKGTSQQQRNTDFMTRGFSIPANARHQ